MKLRLAHCLIPILLVALAGCMGSDPPVAQQELNSQSRSQIEAFLAVARKNGPKGLAELPILLESLEANANTYGEPYIAIRDAAKEVETKLSSAKTPTDLEQAVAPLEAALQGLSEAPQ